MINMNLLIKHLALFACFVFPISVIAENPSKTTIKKDHYIADFNPKIHNIVAKLYGNFTDPSIEQVVVFGVIFPEDWYGIIGSHYTTNYTTDSLYETFLQFKDGHKQKSFHNTSWSPNNPGTPRTCRHPDSNLTYIVNIVNGGGRYEGDIEFVGVNPKTNKLEVVYHEPLNRDSNWYHNEICQFADKKEKLFVLKSAMQALRINIDAESIYGSIGELNPGMTMELPYRDISDGEVKKWLKKLEPLSVQATDLNEQENSALIKLEVIKSDGWKIVQLKGTEVCSGEYTHGVVLAKHATQKNWRAIYNVEAGCSYAINYPLEFEEYSIDKDVLSINMYYEFTYWGEFRLVELNLHTNIITVPNN